MTFSLRRPRTACRWCSDSKGLFGASKILRAGESTSTFQLLRGERGDAHSAALAQGRLPVAGFVAIFPTKAQIVR